MEQLEWPAQSPDLNPIDNLWSYLNWRMRGRVCKTALDLYQILQDEWKRIPLNYLRALVGSTHRRCEAVIATNLLNLDNSSISANYNTKNIVRLRNNIKTRMLQLLDLLD